MNKQLEIINEICRLIYESSDQFDSLEYTYKFNPDEGWESTESHASKNGNNTPLNLPEQVTNEIKALCQKLHSEMKASTGGDWRKFILTIDEDGEVKTNFSYENESFFD